MDDTKFCYQILIITKFVILRLFLILRVIFLLAQKPFLNAHTLSNHLGMTDTVLLHCPISAEIRTLDSQSDLRNFVIVMID